MVTSIRRYLRWVGGISGNVDSSLFEMGVWVSALLCQKTVSAIFENMRFLVSFFILAGGIF